MCRVIRSLCARITVDSKWGSSKGNMTIEVMLSESDAQRHEGSESLNVESTQRKHADGIVTGEKTAK